MKAFDLTVPSEKIWMAIVIAVPFAFSPAIYEGALLPKLLVFQVLLLPLALLALWQKEWIKLPTAYQLAVISYLLLYTLSIAQAPNTLEATFQVAQHFGFIAIFFLITTAISAPQLTRIIYVATWASLPIAIIGLSQYAGITFNIPSNAQPSATFYHRNAAAAYFICVIPLTWIGLQNAKSKRSEYLWAALLCVQGTFLVFTRTRAAWVALIATTVVLYLATRWLLPQKTHQFKSRWLIVSLCIVLSTTLLPENIQGTKRQGFDEKKSDAATAVASIFTPEGNRGRLSLWKNTLSMIAANPLGIGAGNWQFVYPAYAQGQHINVKAAPERPHNDLLWIAAELGLAGLIAFLAIILHTTIVAKALIQGGSPQTRILTLGLCGVILAYLIDGCFSFPHGQVTPTLFFWFALGGIALLYGRTTNHRPALARPTLILGLLVLFASVTITVQRIRYDMYHLKVHTAERKQEWQTVIQQATAARQIGQYRANTFIALGRAYYRTGDLESAYQAYATSLRLHPNSLNAHNNMGIVHRRLGHPKQAVSSFQNAIAIYPHFIEAHYNMGLAYFDLQNYSQALALYQKVIAWGLQTHQVYYSLGRVYHMQGDLIKAQNNYLLALRHNKDFAPAQQALSQLGVSR